MRAFAVYNPLVRHRKACAWVLIEPASDSCAIELTPDARPSDMPLLLSLLARKGQTRIEGYWAWRWVQSRIAPASRDNIDEVLAACKLDEHYAPALLAASKGRCSQDDFLVAEVDSANYRECNLELQLAATASFGTLLARARRAADLTQSQLAEESGVQQAIISRIEAGKGNPTLATMETLATACGRTLRIELD